MAKVDAVSQFVDLAIRRELSPEAQARAFAAFARDGIADAMRTNTRVLGRAPRLQVKVDGRAGVPLETVKPNGVILAEFDLLDEVLRWIAQLLVDRSPVRSGEYVRGHRIFADGREIAVRGGEAVPPAAAYTFLNVVPYARKVEIGRTGSGRAFLIQVPNRIYERTAKDARRRFGNLADISFSFAAPIGGSIVPYGGAASRRGGAERAGRAPAITVRPR